MASLVIENDADPQYILYTDADVMFYNDINSCTLTKPSVIAMGPEFEHNEIRNAGVLYINATAFAEHKDDLISLGVRKGFDYFRGSQNLLLEYFGTKISRLSDEFNWKGYWGDPQGEGQNVSGVTILHWHGPIRCRGF